jgi:hypothetical protein
MASLMDDTETKAAAWALRPEVQRLAEKTFSEIETLLGDYKVSGRDVRWETHHQRLFDYAIFCKLSTDASKVWVEMPHVLKDAANDWQERYSGIVVPCRRR